MNKLGTIFIIIIITLISGLADSQGFIHSSQVWKNDKFIFAEAIQSLLGFVIGTAVFWFAIKYMQHVGVISAEIQTILWFIITIIGVAAVSGKFVQWNIIDQLIAIGVFVGIGILLFRTGG